MKKQIGKGYRTVVMNVLIALPPMLDYVVNNGAVFAPVLGPQGAALLGILGALNIGLRAMTTTPIFHKE